MLVPRQAPTLPAGRGRPWSLLRSATRARQGRLLWAVAGIAAAALLVAVLHGSNRGVRSALRGYLDRPELSVWIAPRGIDNLVRSGGAVPRAWLAELAALPGVSRVGPVLRTFASVEAEAAPAVPGEAVPEPRRQTLLCLFYAAPDGLGAPPELVEGRTPQADDEIALDRAAAYRLRAHAGERVRFNGYEVRVAGITRGTNLLGTQLVFGNLELGRRVLGSADQASFLLVEGAEPERLAQRIREAFPEASVWTGAAFLANSDRELNAGFAGLTWLLSIVGAAVGALVVGLLVQGLVEDCRQDLAVLLALGARASTLALALGMEAMSIVLGGSLLGLALAYALGQWLDHALPTVDLVLSRDAVLIVLGLFASTGGLAGLAPIARLSRIDPMEAFRS